MPQSLDFQQEHLDRVSRSFAFCIRRLPDPLRGWVGLTYLICRILDTVEDADWPDRGQQNAAFQLIDLAISEPATVGALRGWEKSFPEIKDGELRLICDADKVFADFHELPENVRTAVRDLVISMSLGMRHFLERESGGRLKLASLSEVNQYCFFVAGLVGEALSHLLSSVEPRFPSNVSNLLRAHHFGLFLQKVNILKDQAEDEASGRLLVPSRPQLEASAGADAKEALEFLCTIPEEQIEFRQFCGWSLFLGLETLVGKVTRLQTTMLLEKIDSMITDNKRLQDYFFERAKALGWTFKGPTFAPSPEWIAKLYRGRLDANSLGQLGMA